MIYLPTCQRQRTSPLELSFATVNSAKLAEVPHQPPSEYPATNANPSCTMSMSLTVSPPAVPS